ncbi:MAG: sporulation integral membrane protein YlbJ, partial [Limnochordia bacterium]
MVKSLDRSHVTAYLSALLGMIIAIAIIWYPEAAFDASLYGLKLWFEVVLPALLPFFAMCDILMGLGVVHFMGVLLEPLMRPVFRIPGVGGFAVAMGLASGYPIGARITGRLRRENLCDQVEGERLVSFANTADPLFMMGAVAVGMFGMPQLGVTIVIAHYASVVLVGFLMRYHGQDSHSAEMPTRRENIFRRALRELYRHRQADGRPFGQLFGDSVKDSFAAMLFIGGCIMMFSVLLRVFTLSGITAILSRSLEVIIASVGLAPSTTEALVNGLFEITIGTEAASRISAPLIQRAVVASAVIGWSGMSVHTQVASMLHGTDIRMTPYIIARFLHGVFAGIITYLLLGPAQPVVQLATPVLAHALIVDGQMDFAARFLASAGLFLRVLGSLLLVG